MNSISYVSLENPGKYRQCLSFLSFSLKFLGRVSPTFFVLLTFLLIVTQHHLQSTNRSHSWTFSWHDQCELPLTACSVCFWSFSSTSVCILVLICLFVYLGQGSTTFSRLDLNLDPQPVKELSWLYWFFLYTTKDQGYKLWSCYQQL